MKFGINERTLNMIKKNIDKKSKGAFFIKVKPVGETCASGSIPCLWAGIENPELQNLKLYDEYDYQGIKIYILKGLEVAETVSIWLDSKFIFGKPIFSIQGVIYVHTFRRKFRY